MREYLVTVVGGRHYHGRGGRRFDQLGDGTGPGQRGVAGQPVRLDRVGVGHAGYCQRTGRYFSRGPEHDSGHAGAGGEVAAERQRAQRGIGRAVAIALDQA